MTATPPLAAEVHDAMCAFVTGSRWRRSVPPVLCLGRPAGEQRRVVDASWYDAGTRADLVTRALDGLACPHPLVWLGRTGGLEVAPVDLSWLAAARAAHGRHGLDLRHFFVVTRQGWADLVAGEEHPWHRVRPARHVS
ncbi:MAG: hypothetical protein ACTHNS_12505 [Marmoricola sp.]